jgi:hypothetical protein
MSSYIYNEYFYLKFSIVVSFFFSDSYEFLELSNWIFSISGLSYVSYTFIKKNFAKKFLESNLNLIDF